MANCPTDRAIGLMGFFLKDSYGRAGDFDRECRAASDILHAGRGKVGNRLMGAR